MIAPAMTTPRRGGQGGYEGGRGLGDGHIALRRAVMGQRTGQRRDHLILLRLASSGHRAAAGCRGRAPLPTRRAGAAAAASACAASRWIAHDPAPGRDRRRPAFACITAALIEPSAEPHADSSASSTAPSRARPAARCRRSPPAAPVALRQRAASGDDPGQPAQLFAADRRLHVGHAVVVAADRDSPRRSPARCRGAACRAPTCRAGASSRKLASSSASAVVSMPPSPVVITLRGWNEKQTMSPCGAPIRRQLPSSRISDPIAQAASSISGSPCARATAMIARQVAGHAHLVDAEDRPGARRDRRRDRRRIDVEAAGLDVDEDRHRAALADGVGARR